ncbi:hypothetical protein BT69DRAFT_1292303 [Atractiella rhizophila]|nr:hypothetical protein BT69DRAFT_1292303 [Atractiella rhizophila]
MAMDHCTKFVWAEVIPDKRVETIAELLGNLFMNERAWEKELMNSVMESVLEGVRQNYNTGNITSQGRNNWQWYETRNHSKRLRQERTKIGDKVDVREGNSTKATEYGFNNIAGGHTIFPHFDPQLLLPFYLSHPLSHPMFDWNPGAVRPFLEEWMLRRKKRGWRIEHEINPDWSYSLAKGVHQEVHVF